MKNQRTLRILFLLFIAALTLAPSKTTSASVPTHPVNAGSSTTSAMVQVWNDAYGSNLTSTTSLGVGTEFDVKVNITNAGPINGYDISLNYNMSAFVPTVLQAVKTGSETTGSLFDPNSPPAGCQIALIKSEVDIPPGKIRFAAVVLGQCTVDGTNGTLFTVHFKVVGTGTASIDVVQASHGQLASQVVGPPPQLSRVPVRYIDAYFRNKSGTPPILIFTRSPLLPMMGDNVTFDAGQSYDPDNPSGPFYHGIQRFVWTFDDGSPLGNVFGVQVRHVFVFGPANVFGVGYFQVRLVAIDTDDGLAMRRDMVVYISPPAPPTIHDIAVSLALGKSQVHQGDNLVVTATVVNVGTVNETASLNVTIDYNGQTVIGRNSSFTIARSASASFNFTLQTSNLPLRSYTVTAAAQLLGNITDANPSDNVYSIIFSLLPPPYIHNVAISYVYAPYRAIAGQKVPIYVIITNLSVANQTETVSLAVSYDSTLIINQTGTIVPPYGAQVSIIWDTTGVPPGNHTLTSTVYLATDQNPADNTFIGPTVKVLPGPVLTLSSSNGTVGSKVMIHGSNFPVPGYIYNPFGEELIVSFDDQLLGFAFTRDGSFNFTFDVPLALPGIHLVKAQDPYFGLIARIQFTVLASPPAAGKLEIVVDTGTIYFPGDTAVFYVLSRANGVPAKPDQLQILLIKPYGTNATLQWTSIDVGVFKASYSIPKTTIFGTYALVVSGQKTGLNQGTGLLSFEVKPSWLSSQGPKVVGVASVLGMVATVAVAWQRGYLRKNEDE